MVEAYHVALVIIGLAIFGAVVLPRLLDWWPLSLPILYVGAGALLFAALLGIEPPPMVADSGLVDRLTELVVIIALMGAGLKIDRPPSITGWSPTWRLLGVTMPMTIAETMALGWGVLGLNLTTAVLLGAVVAPTDPVLVSDVEAGPPLADAEETVDRERNVRSSLTTEAGLNDGLAFPFTNLAVASTGASSESRASMVQR